MSNLRKLCLIIVISTIIQINKTPVIDDILLIVQLILTVSIVYETIVNFKDKDSEKIITYKNKRYRLLYKRGMGKSCPLIEPLDEKTVPNEVVDYVYFKIIKK